MPEKSAAKPRRRCPLRYRGAGGVVSFCHRFSAAPVCGALSSSGRRGGPGGASAAAIRQAVGVIGPAIRPKAGRARHHRAGAARRRAVLAALGLAVCRRCSMARRSAVCWHRAGGRRWHGMQQAVRRGAGRCRWCAAGVGCCRRCSVSGPAKQAKRKRPGRRRVVRRSSRPFLLLLSPRCRAVFAVCRRGQILHLTAYRCSGKG